MGHKNLPPTSSSPFFFHPLTVHVTGELVPKCQVNLQLWGHCRLGILEKGHQPLQQLCSAESMGQRK